MKIASVKVAGFRGVQGELSLSFPRGFVVITGANGAGKSTVCDAIEYAICGTLSNLNPATEGGEGIAEYVWWRGKVRPEKRYVEIEIERDDGTPFRIHRNAQGLLGATEREVQDFLCEKASRPLDSPTYLCRTSILRGEQISELSLDLPEVARFSFVKACLGATDYTEIEKSASALAKAFKTRSDSFEADYAKIRLRVMEVTSQISSIKAQAFRAEEMAGAERYIRQVSNNPSGEMIEAARASKAKASTLRATLESLLTSSRQLSVIEGRLSEVSTPEFVARKDAVERSLLSARARLEQLQKDAQALETRIQTHSLTAGVTAEWAGLLHHGSTLGLQDGRCPLCAQALSASTFSERLQAIKEHVESHNKALADLIRQKNENSESLRRGVTECDAFERQFRDLSTVTDSLKTEHSTLIDKIRALGIRQSSDSLLTQNILAEDAESLKLQLSTLEKHLTVLDGSTALDRITELEKELAKCKSDSEELANLITKAKGAAERFKDASDVAKRVAGEIVDERLAELSPLLVELYSRLKPHVDWPTVSYISRGDVRRFLSLRVGDGLNLNPRFMFSNGQRRAVGLAFLLAVHLSRSWCHLNSLILDDPVQHIDDFRALHLVEVLSAIRQRGRQIICTIEDPELAKLMCRRLRSVKNEEGVLITLQYEPEKGIHIQENKPIVPIAIAAILAA